MKLSGFLKDELLLLYKDANDPPPAPLPLLAVAFGALLSRTLDVDKDPDPLPAEGERASDDKPPLFFIWSRMSLFEGVGLLDGNSCFESAFLGGGPFASKSRLAFASIWPTVVLYRRTGFVVTELVY